MGKTNCFFIKLAKNCKKVSSIQNSWNWCCIYRMKISKTAFTFWLIFWWKNNVQISMIHQNNLQIFVLLIPSEMVYKNKEINKKIAFHQKQSQKCQVAKSAYDPIIMSFTWNSMEKNVPPPYLIQFLKDKSNPFKMMYETYTNHHFLAQMRALKCALQTDPYLVRLNHICRFQCTGSSVGRQKFSPADTWTQQHVICQLFHWNCQRITNLSKRPFFLIAFPPTDRVAVQFSFLLEGLQHIRFDVGCFG